MSADYRNDGHVGKSKPLIRNTRALRRGLGGGLPVFGLEDRSPLMQRYLDVNLYRIEESGKLGLG